MRTVDILSPHYDDAVLSCWNQIEIGDANIITVFGGEPPANAPGAWDTLSTGSNSADTIAARRAENHLALEGTSATTIDLDFLDRQYVLFKKRSIAEISDRIGESLTPGSNVIAALGIGLYLRVHPDHVTTRKAALELAKQGHDVSFYADIPYLLPARDLSNWPERISAEKIKRKLDSPVTIEPVELTPEQQARKKTAVQAFASQLPMVNKLALGALSKPDAYRWEAIIKLG